MSVYSGVEEDIPLEIPTPRGKSMVMTTFVDANLLFCRATGHSVSGILHMMNMTPVDWFTKLQNTVESATYGLECMAA